MSHRIKQSEWEGYYLAANGFGVVDAHEQHVPRISEILSEQNPGIVFIWDAPGPDGMVTISAVREDKRKVSAKAEAKLVAAGEAIGRNVAKKYPVVKPGLIGGLFAKRLKPGWHFTPAKAS